MARQLKLSYIIEATEGASTAVLDKIGSKLDAVGRSYAGLAATVGAGLEFRSAVNEDSYFRQLAALTQTPLERLNKIKSHLHDISQEAKVSSDEMTQSMAAFRAGGGTFDDFDKSARTAASAVAVLGGHGAEVGRIMAAMDRSFEIKGPEKLAANLAMTVSQIGMVNGDIMAYAQAFPDLAARYAAIGHTGSDAARELGAVYLTLQQTARSPRAAFGAVNGVLDMMSTEHGRQAFTARTGIGTQDAGGNARSLTDVIRDIAVASQSRGQRYLLEGALDGQSIAAIQKFVTPAGQEALAKLLAAKGDPAALQASGADATSGLGGSMTQIREKLKSNFDWAVEELGGLAPALDGVSGAAAGVLTVLAGVGTAGGLVSGISMLGGALGIFGGNVDKAARAAAAAKSAGVEYFAGKGFGSAGAAGTESAAAATVGGTTLVGAIAAGASLGIVEGLGNYYANKYLADVSHGEIDPYGGPIDPMTGMPTWSMRSPAASAPRGSSTGSANHHVANDGAMNAVDAAFTMEHAGSRSAALREYLQNGGENLDPATAAWCAAFVNASLARQGIKGATDVATSFETWGDPVKPGDVMRGDVLIKTRGLRPGEVGGHVGLATGRKLAVGGEQEDEMISGNSHGEVRTSWVRASDVMARRANASDTKVGGQIVVRIEKDGSARVTSMRSDNPAVPLTYQMGVGMDAP
jgi:hypothetical protein